MTNKKDDLPAMPFYVGDWLKAPDIQCLDYELKGIWFEMLCYMWESRERGVLLYSKDELSRLLRLPEVLLEQKLKHLLEKGIYSIRESDGAIYSRRMIKDQKLREIRKKIGQIGGKRSFVSRFASRFASDFAQAKIQANAENENENENVKKERIVKERKQFAIPTPDEVKSYCLERKNHIDHQQFLDYYQANGWKVGKNPMKDWRAAVRTWERNGYSQPKPADDGVPESWKTPKPQFHRR